jgi:UDP-N-acetylmuramate--alanine ligase
MIKELSEYKNIYFLGIGGIGMSALARFFNNKEQSVAGYDRTKTPLCEALESEGIAIHYDDNIALVDKKYLDKDNTLIVYTPAIPNDHKEFNYFLEHQFDIIKRAKALGLISKAYKTIGVSGTHGKTTISTMCTHLLNSSKVKANGFLGGISNNFDSNLVLSKASDIVVTEADEFDRSFLNLYPNTILISSMDADHLDIYGAKEELHKSFFEFIDQMETNGTLIQKIDLPFNNRKDIKRWTYSLDDSRADYYAKNIRLNGDTYQFDFQTPGKTYSKLELGVPGLVNLENAVGASAVAVLNQVSEAELREGLLSYKGVKRRFDYRFKSNKTIYIDDYAHHPEELKAFIGSVREIYPNKKILGIFQPHLYSRTQDFAPEFAKSLSMLDELLLMDIYPARELPIEGVSSKIIFDKVELEHKTLCNKDNIMAILSEKEFDVVLTMGAGDIDIFVSPIESYVKTL